MNKKLRKKKTKQKIIIVMNEHYLYEYMLTLTTFATSYHMRVLLKEIQIASSVCL